MELMDLAMKDGKFRSKRDAREGGGKEVKGKGRGMCGVDFGPGIGYNAEPGGTSMHSVPSRSATSSSQRSEMGFVPTSSNSQSPGSTPVLVRTPIRDLEYLDSSLVVQLAETNSPRTINSLP